MKKNSLVFTVVLVLSLSLGIFAVQSGQDLFQKALAKERAEGNLEEAIALYQKVIDESQDQSLKAQAQLRIGLCYEKLGQKSIKQAQEAFQKVIDNYPEQSELIKTAREKLARIIEMQASVEESDREFNIQLVWAQLDAAISNLGTVSPDGLYISYTNRDSSDLALLELSTKKLRRLTNNWSSFKVLQKKTLTKKKRESIAISMRFAVGSAWSPDGRQIAYGWCGYMGGSDLRLIDLDGSEPRILCRNDDFMFTFPLDWSPDGKHILAFFGNKDFTGQAVLVSVADGSMRILTKYDKPFIQVQTKVLFSPDGGYIVYSFEQIENSKERDIFLLSVDGNRKIKLIEHPADDFVLGWAPDGERLLFASDRTGEISCWIIEVSNGEPQGDAELIKKDIGEIRSLGITRKGSFYYGLEVRMEDVYTASLDLEKSKILISPEKVNQRLEGSTFFPDWSPDGKYLAYISGEKLYIQSLETGDVREIAPNLSSFGPLRWSPDSRSILTSGGGNGVNGVFEIDMKTGHVTTIVQFAPEDYVRWATWSPDRKNLFYKYKPTIGDLNSRLIVYNPVSKQEKVLYRELSWPTFMALSPDGRFLAFITLNQENLSTTLNIMPSSGGELRQVLMFKYEELIRTVAWTPDGRKLLYAKLTNNGNKCELWQISVEGGEPKNFGLAMDHLNYLSIHPDGRRIAFCSSHESGEIWVMENFLPKTTDKK